jgi:hypothetical protein
MPRYYINQNAQPYPEDNEHEVHADEFCSHAPSKENRIDLGVFLTCEAAMSDARRRFQYWKIDGCAYCNERCHKI